jgi:hypothetical protein
MISENDILKKLSADILNSINSYIVTLYKVNKNHRLFLELKKQYPELEAAEYVVYPNLNNSIPTTFLSQDGEELLVYQDGISEFILISLDSKVIQESISISNPYILNTNTNGNFSW